MKRGRPSSSDGQDAIRGTQVLLEKMAETTTGDKETTTTTQGGATEILEDHEAAASEETVEDKKGRREKEETGTSENMAQQSLQHVMAATNDAADASREEAAESTAATTTNHAAAADVAADHQTRNGRRISGCTGGELGHHDVGRTVREADARPHRTVLDRSTVGPEGQKGVADVEQKGGREREKQTIPEDTW